MMSSAQTLTELILLEIIFNIQATGFPAWLSLRWLSPKRQSVPSSFGYNFHLNQPWSSSTVSRDIICIYLMSVIAIISKVIMYNTYKITSGWVCWTLQHSKIFTPAQVAYITPSSSSLYNCSLIQKCQRGWSCSHLGNILEVHKKAFTTQRCFPRSKQNVEYQKFKGLSWNLISDFLLQPGTDEPGLHVVMLDARYDRDPTYAFHGFLFNSQNLLSSYGQ